MTVADVLLRALRWPPCRVREVEDYWGLDRLDDESLDEEGCE